MSTIVCIKDANTIVIGTDSRFMRSDFATLASDSVQKLFELAPGLFLATCGWSPASDFLALKAPELVRDSQDIRVLAAALDRACRPCLHELVSALSMLPPHTRIEDALSGREPVFGFFLAGRSNGKLGFVHNEYFFRDGELVLKADDYFDRPRLIKIVNHHAAPEQIRQDPATWTDSPVRVAMRILEVQKRASPFVGGQSQVALIDDRGGRWVNRPPAAAMRATQPACATISAAISMTAPTITVTGSPFTINLDSANGLKISGNGTTTTLNNISSGGFVQAMKAVRASDGYHAVVDPSAFICYDNSNNANAYMLNALGSGSIQVGRGGSVQASLAAGIGVNGADLHMLDSAGAVGVDINTTTTYTATSASAGAQTLPANPVGFLIVTIAGTARKIPYYA